jgi:hypothetical protein
VFLAYIDGGSGSMALQLLLAGALSAVYAFHTGWARIKTKFMKSASTDSTTSSRDPGAAR